VRVLSADDRSSRSGDNHRGSSSRHVGNVVVVVAEAKWASWQCGQLR